MSNTLDLRKEILLDLKKQKGISDQKARVILALDYSGSMGQLYRSGAVQELVERILPIGLTFDSDESIEFYIFDNHYHKLDNVTVRNYHNFVDNRIINNYHMGGTSYAPVINAILDGCGCGGGKVAEHKGGLLNMFRKKESPATHVVNLMSEPVYIIFITDGNNDDKKATEDVMREASKHGVFFQFIGIGREAFTFLDKLDNLDGRMIDNANFFKVEDLSKMSDNELYSKLMSEFPLWLPLAKKHQLIQ